MVTVRGIGPPLQIAGRRSDSGLRGHGEPSPHGLDQETRATQEPEKRTPLETQTMPPNVVSGGDLEFSATQLEIIGRVSISGLEDVAWLME